MVHDHENESTHIAFSFSHDGNRLLWFRSWCKRDSKEGENSLLGSRKKTACDELDRLDFSFGRKMTLDREGNGGNLKAI